MDFNDNNKFRPDPTLRLMDQMRQMMRYNHYAYRTEQTYCDGLPFFGSFFGQAKRNKMLILSWSTPRFEKKNNFLRKDRSQFKV
jgi:hypothetical protein